ADENVGPAIVVEIEEAAAPSQILRMQAKSGLEGGIFEAPVALVAIERGCISGKIGFQNVEVAVEIVISGRDSHARLWFPVGAKHATGFQPHLNEFAVLLVLVHQGLGGIV